jgi:hypothetical protein
MEYTNGFDKDVILPALRGRIGWQSEGVGIVRSFESFHALCTEQNLRDTQPTENISDAGFTAFKESLEDSIIQRCLSSVFSKPENIEQVLLHKRWPGSLKQVIENTGLFCGIRFKVAESLDISVQVKTVTLLFDQDVTFPLYLFGDGNDEPLAHYNVSAVGNVPTVIDLENAVMAYSSGYPVFYLGYFQADLADVRAIRESVTYKHSNCFCGESFNAAQTGVQSFNQSQVSWGYDSYGINAEVHSFRDYTAKIRHSASLFDEAIGLSMVYYLIEQILSTTRSNARERILKGGYERIELTHYLYGAVPAMGVAKTKGLNDILADKFKEIREAFYPAPKAQTVSLC